ncbi:MAG: hypothetical protein IT436_17955 [Phycisphaerales bacterium]|nr:hypothetical protein [Phycisphaerales bacterium]
MKRLALILAVSLLFGAVVNVLVAWGCLLRKPFPGSAPWTRGGTAYRWPITVPATWPDKPSSFEQTYGTGWALHTTRGFSESTGINFAGMREHTVEVWHCGWPRAALRAIAITSDSDDPTTTELLDGIPMPGFLLPLANWKPAYLPTRPEPKAFTINTLLYGLPITVPLLIIRPVRRWRRRRAGLCPHCRYPFGASPVCTECGRSLPARAIPESPT